ncbi:DUF3087 family protein [Thalassotalea aquiviva]|uniref:DUF3087 family protein n=1 Tax=Thalassotalea aquiviva TaxID=3242415 RepID=UPI00352A54C5
MQLKAIDKDLYRQRLNYLIIAFILAFASLAIGLGQLLIWATERQGADNFWLNFFGVAIALPICISVVNRFKHHPKMSEIYYVWQLKQQINFIYRKLKKIKQAGFEKNNLTALIILTFYYEACFQLYNLDDNTITLSSLKKEQQRLLEHCQSLNYKTASNAYHQRFLADF